MIPGYDGLYASTDYPPETPELTPPPKAVPHWAKPVTDALTREEYLAIGRPILKAAGFLQDEAVADKPTLPKMPNSRPKKRQQPKPKITPPKPDETVPF